MGFLFRKTTGRASSFPRANVSSEETENTGAVNSINYSIPFFRRTEVYGTKNRRTMHARGDYSRLLTPGYYARSSGNRSGSGASIRRSRRIPWESLDRPPRASILWTNWEENYQSRCSVWTFLKADRISSDGFNGRSHKSEDNWRRGGDNFAFPWFAPANDYRRRRESR